MPKPTPDQIPQFQAIFDLVPFKPSIPPQHVLLPVELDDIPEVNEKGYRRAEGWRASWEGVVEEGWGNYVGAMHGAAAAWLIDSCTSAALIGLHTESFWGPPMLAGVSISLGLEYYHPAKVGSKIRIDVEVVKLTLTLANLKCEIRDLGSRKLYCSGTHIKAWKPIKNESKLYDL